MRKLGIILLFLALLASFSACGSGQPEKAEKSVTVTIPAAMVGSQDEENIQKQAEAEDMEVTIAEDGSVTYTMTPEKQQELLLGFKTHFEESLTTVLDNGEVPGLVNVDYNDDMSAFTVTVQRDIFDQETGEEELGLLYSAGTAYQLYAGKAEEAIDVAVTLVDQDTKEEYEHFSMREVFNAQQSPGDNAD